MSWAWAEIVQSDGFITDTETQLDWRDVRLTRNVAYNDVVAQMAPGGLLEGWRLATREELTLLLRHFIVPNSPDSACAPDGYCDYYGDAEPPSIARAIEQVGDTLRDFWESDLTDAQNYEGGSGGVIGFIEWPGFSSPQVVHIYDGERYLQGTGEFLGDDEDYILMHLRSQGGFGGLAYLNHRADRITGSLLVRTTDTEDPQDADQDGFTDDAELNGLDVDGDGIVDLDLPGLGADPCRKTIVIEIDYMDGLLSGFPHAPHPDVIGTLVESFDAAPLSGIEECAFEGFPTAPGGVNFIGYVDQQIPERDGVFDTRNGFSDVRQVYFDENLLPYVHYVVYAHALDDGGTTSGVCCNEGGLIVSLGNWGLDQASDPTGNTRVEFFDPAGKQDDRLIIEAGTLMHELGHALGLRHGGPDNINYKPNYLSVMNYTFQTRGIMQSDDPARINIDYSRTELPELDEAALLETQPLCASPDCAPFITAWERDDGSTDREFSDTTTATDWNYDDVLDVDPVDQDINFNWRVEADKIFRCVGDGPDDVFQTIAANDDVESGDVIQTGADGVCDTAASSDSDDSQLAAVGTLPDIVHIGHDDWNAIRYLAAESVYGDGASAYEVSDSTEIDAEEAHEIGEFWDAVRAELIQDMENEPPLIDGPERVVLEANDPAGWAGNLVEVADIEASDPNGGDVTLVSNASAILPLGETVVQWTATDEQGASSHLNQTIEVVDTTPPELIVPDNVLVTATGPLTGVVMSEATATDLFGTTVTNDAPSAFPVGDTPVTWRAVDSNGNVSEAVQRVSIVYAFGGLVSPFKEGGIYKLGRTLSLKLILSYADGTPVLDAAPTFAVHATSNGEPIGSPLDTESSSAADSGNTFRYSDGIYIHNLDTSFAAPDAYVMFIWFGDGGETVVNFSLK